MFASHEKMLFMHTFDLFEPPVFLAFFHLLSLPFTFFLKVSDVNLLYLKLDASQLDYVVLFQIILLLDVAVSDISNN